MRQSRIPGGAYVNESASGRQSRLPGDGFINSYSAAVVMDFSGTTVISGSFTTVGSSLTINMDNATMNVGVNFDLTGCTEFNNGCSTVLLNSATSAIITLNSKTLYLMILGVINIAKIITWTDGGKFNRLQIKARNTVYFKDGATYWPWNYTDGDWDGNSSYKTILRSTTPGTYWNLINISWT